MPVASASRETKRAASVTPHTPTKAKTSVGSTTASLFRHQEQSIAKLSKTPILFDTSDPGTGKTRVQIEAFAKRRRKNGGKALILATKSLLEAAWKADFKRFAPDIEVSLAFAHNREAAMGTHYDVLIVNHDGVKALPPPTDKFWKVFDTLIIDESTAFKHYTSQRSKALAKLAKNFKYRSCMTGTPTSNTICDIWHQVFILDDGQRLGKSFFGFRASVCTPEQVGPRADMIKWVDRPGAESVVVDIIKDITIRHRFEDCVDIPENYRYAQSFTLSKNHRSKYQSMEDDQFLKLRDVGVTAVNGAVVYQKLLQIASGAVYDDSGNYSLVDTARYVLIADLVEARKHSIVFFSWTHQREELVREATKRGISYAVFDGDTTDKQRSEIVKNYQAGEYQVLFAHPASAGHGLTLTKGTATIWASPTYNLEHFLQGLKRIHRIGQTERTETIVVVAEDTIDEKVWAVLQAKDAKQGDLLNILREELT